MSQDKRISVKAIVLGALTDLGGTLLIQVVLGVVLVVLGVTRELPLAEIKERLQSPMMLTVLAVLGLGVTSVAGFVAAWIAGCREILHGGLVGAVGVVWGMLFAVSSLDSMKLLLILPALPMGMLGGWLRQKLAGQIGVKHGDQSVGDSAAGPPQLPASQTLPPRLARDDAHLDNPYLAPASAFAPAAPVRAGQWLLCPCCNQEFAMTWRRYFSARLGRYRCPHCGRVSRLKKRVPWLTETIAVLIAMVPAVAAHHCLLAESGTIGVVVYSFVVFLVAIPRDRYFDHRFGRLTRPPEKGGN